MDGLLLQNQRNEWTYIAPRRRSTIDLTVTPGLQTWGPVRPLNYEGAIIRKHIHVPGCITSQENQTIKCEEDLGRKTTWMH